MICDRKINKITDPIKGLTMLDHNQLKLMFKFIKETLKVVDRYTYKKILQHLYPTNDELSELVLYEIKKRIGLKRGKPKLRAPLVRLIYQALTKSENWEPVLPLCAAIEVWAISSYVIDDVLDNQPERGGAPTTWAKYGSGKAIIAGIIQIGLAERILYDLITEKDKFYEIQKQFTQLFFGIYYAQFLNEKGINTEHEYMERTKYLGADPLPFTEAVAIMCNKKDKIEIIRGIVENLCIVSMLRNDIMDIFTMPGREPFEDLRKGLLTFPYLHLMKSSEENKNLVNKLKNKQKLTKKGTDTLMKAFSDSKSISAMLDLITSYKEKAKNFIMELEPSKYREYLLYFAELFESGRTYAKKRGIE